MGEIGSLDLWPVNCGCAWTCYPSIVKLYYYGGLEPLTLEAEDTIIRLAHAKMPRPPCGCDLAVNAWTRDREVPEFIDQFRASNPFGPQAGAVVAYRFATAQRLVRATNL